MRVNVLGALLLFATVLLFGCDNYARFRTDGMHVFRGNVVGTAEDSFIRRGFPPETTLELEFDPDAAAGRMAGVLTTRSPDGTSHFDHTELMAIESLQHDLLSQYDFPGSGRTRNYILAARPDSGPLGLRDAMVFLSLLDNGTVEVRIIVGSGDESRGDVFGLFSEEIDWHPIDLTRDYMEATGREMRPLRNHPSSGTGSVGHIHLEP